jgi:hypothetical protein
MRTRLYPGRTREAEVTTAEFPRWPTPVAATEDV